MKRKIYIYLLFFVAINLFSQTEGSDLVKRTILILPAYNINKDPANNNLVTAIRDALRAKLIAKNMFNIIDFSTIDRQFKELGYNEEDCINEDKMIILAKNLNADVVLISKFLAIGDNILITTFAVDIFLGQATVSSFIDGELGIEVFRYVNNITNEMADKMAVKFTALDRGKLNELLKSQAVIIEEEDKEVINNLLKKKDKYKKVEIKRGKENVILAIPHGRNIVIFVGGKEDVFTVEMNNEAYQSKNGIKIIMLDNAPNKVTKFSLKKEGFKTIVYDYKQKEEYELHIKKINFIK